jgi:hypothetical protein
VGHLRSREALHTLSACVTAFLSSFMKWRALSSSLAAAASYRLRLWPAPIALAGEARQTGTPELDLQSAFLDQLLQAESRIMPVGLLQGSADGAEPWNKRAFSSSSSTCFPQVLLCPSALQAGRRRWLSRRNVQSTHRKV